MANNDGFRWYPHATVRKYDQGTVAEMERRLGRPVCAADFDDLAPDALVEGDGNVLTSLAAARMAALFIGESVQAMTTTRTVCGVGNSSTAAAASQTDLQAAAGSTNRWFQGADPGYPSRSGAVLTVKSTFLGGDGNFAWNEWCLAIATAAPVASSVFATATTSGIMVNRKVETTWGTKNSGEVWVLTGTLTGQ